VSGWAEFVEGLREQGFRFTVAQRDYAGHLMLYGYQPPRPKLEGVSMELEDIHAVDASGQRRVMPVLTVKGL
jgi:hypothetical protein